MQSNAVKRVNDANPVDNPETLAVLESLLESGHAKLRIGRHARRQIDRTLATAQEFYAKPIEYKRQFASPAYVEGYRDIGLEYSARPDRPDLTESFSLWNRNRRHAEMQAWNATCPLHAELRRTADALSPLVGELFQAMADRWAPGESGPRFELASYLQLNYYEPAQHRRDMLQDGHEDGHLITLVTATGPGLEAKINGQYVPVELKDDEMLIMPGSLLSLMTGNLIPPLYHQVKNSFRKEPRYSMMYFVNPEIDQKLDPWVLNETNAGIDIAEEANKQPQKFGLPTLIDGTSGRGK